MYYHEPKELCELCNNNPGGLKRHRINPEGSYTDWNVIMLCYRCRNIVLGLKRDNKKNGITGVTGTDFINAARAIVESVKAEKALIDRIIEIGSKHG